MKEVWKPTKGNWPGYAVSTLGRVKSLTREETVVRYGKTYIRRRNERMLALIPDRYGYLYVHLCSNGKVKAFKVHRLVARAFIPNPDRLPIVRHRDDDPSNNRQDNLDWGTHDDNVHDMVSRKRHPHGENHGRALLTEKQVLTIRNLLNRGRTYKMLADRYGVRLRVIQKIDLRVTWKHL